MKTGQTRFKVQLGAQAFTPLQQRLQEFGDVVEVCAGEVLDLNIVRTCFGFVLSGQLQLTWRDGPNQNGIYPLHKGHWFGMNNLVLDEPFQSLRFEASCFTRVLVIQAKPFRDRLGLDLAELDGPLREEMMQFYALRWHELAERHHRALFVPNDELLMDALFDASTWVSAMSHPEGTLVKAGREFLAQRLGCTRVTVSRSLARLVADGRVRLEGRKILLIGHQGRGDAAKQGR